MKNKTLSQSLVKEISENEPAWMLKKREDSWRIFSSMRFSDLNDSPKSGRYTNMEMIDLEKESARASISLESKKNGIIVGNLNDALKQYPSLIESHLYSCVKPSSHKLAALNSALWNNGVFVYVPKNVSANIPITASITSPYKSALIFTHTLIIADEGSAVNYFEASNSEPSEYPSYNSSVVEIYAKKNAMVNFFSLQNFGLSDNVFSWQGGILDEGAEINWNNGLFGGKLSILINESHFHGENSKTANNGIFFLNKNQHADISTNAHHRVPYTKNEMDWKGILDDDAVSVYRGLIDIGPEAKKTKSTMKEHTIMLSKNAKSNALPSLSIKTNDVQAKHGTTCGYLDETELFYLMSRGLSRAEARKMILFGFFNSLLEKIPFEAIKNMFESKTNEKMKNEHE
jgi:Fe-S cluster assembly protein SufD